MAGKQVADGKGSFTSPAAIRLCGDVRRRTLGTTTTCKAWSAIFVSCGWFLSRDETCTRFGGGRRKEPFPVLRHPGRYGRQKNHAVILLPSDGAAGTCEVHGTTIRKKLRMVFHSGTSLSRVKVPGGSLLGTTEKVFNSWNTFFTVKRTSPVRVLVPPGFRQRLPRPPGWSPTSMPSRVGGGRQFPQI